MPETTDTIKAKLTPGEFVIRKEAVDMVGLPLLNKINDLPKEGGHSEIDKLINMASMENMKPMYGGGEVKMGYGHGGMVKDNMMGMMGGGMANKPMMGYAHGGMAKNLKPVPEDNPGLGKLPDQVRNRMGYMQEGGLAIRRSEYKEPDVSYVNIANLDYPSYGVEPDLFQRLSKKYDEDYNNISNLMLGTGRDEPARDIFYSIGLGNESSDEYAKKIGATESDKALAREYVKAFDSLKESYDTKNRNLGKDYYSYKKGVRPAGMLNYSESLYDEKQLKQVKKLLSKLSESKLYKDVEGDYIDVLHRNMPSKYNIEPYIKDFQEGGMVEDSLMGMMYGGMAKKKKGYGYQDGGEVDRGFLTEDDGVYNFKRVLSVPASQVGGKEGFRYYSGEASADDLQSARDIAGLLANEKMVTAPQDSIPFDMIDRFLKPEKKGLRAFLPFQEGGMVGPPAPQQNEIMQPGQTPPGTLMGPSEADIEQLRMMQAQGLQDSIQQSIVDKARDSLQLMQLLDSLGGETESIENIGPNKPFLDDGKIYLDQEELPSAEEPSRGDMIRMLMNAGMRVI